MLARSSVDPRAYVAWHYHTFPQVLPLTFIFFNWNLPSMKTSLTLASPLSFLHPVLVYNFWGLEEEASASS